ncbi:MAG TPA: OB-fold nucleic acid binding domain-containing protein, partial [Alphaproteobacteria bacterium]|nr:OB-fold nucleic acid binding domain-containing protein [Alphaproteobacteria bacterium]
MRPEILFPLFRPVTALKGVGPRIGTLIEQLAGPQVVDLCWHLPSGLIDRRFRPRIAEAPDGATATITLRVERHLPPSNARLPYKVVCRDDSGELTLVFFNARSDYLQKVLPEGEVRVVSGKVAHYGGELQMAHPDFIVKPDELDSLPLVEPIYPLTAGLTAKPLLRAVQAAVASAPALPEWQDPAWRQRQGWPGWHDALRAAHAPGNEAALAPGDPARQRLAYDELL